MQAAADDKDLRSEETCVGCNQHTNFASPGGIRQMRRALTCIVGAAVQLLRSGRWLDDRRPVRHAE